MYNSLNKGSTYKVRLKPLERLLEDCNDFEIYHPDSSCWCVNSPHHKTNAEGWGLCKWISKYLDGSVGLLTFSGGNSGAAQSVKWLKDGSVWKYKVNQLKVLGEV